MKKDFLFFLKRTILIRLYQTSRFFGLNKNSTSILCYHGISNNSEKHSLRKEILESQIRKISKHSKFISLEKAVDILDGRKIIGSNVVLTFDDGFASLMDILPIIKEYDIKPTVFVLSDPACANRAELNNRERLLSIKEIKALHKNGWTIGCHSATHTDFNMLSSEEIKKQIIDSKSKLENNLGFAINFFAYPKGIFNENIINIVKEGEYRAAFSILPGAITRKSNRWILPRTVIDSSHNVDEFPAVYSQTNFFVRKITNRFNIWDKFF